MGELAADSSNKAGGCLTDSACVPTANAVIVGTTRDAAASGQQENHVYERRA